MSLPSDETRSTSGSEPPRIDPATLAAGGIYIKWRDRLWQEQPDGSYLVWDEQSHTWERSERQPPREGGAVQTKECPSCGRRVKVSFRACPHCSYAFPTAVSDTPRDVAAPSKKVTSSSGRWYQRQVPNSVGLLLIILVVAATAYVVISTRAGDGCEGWKAANEAFARNAALAQGDDPDGEELAGLIEHYEDRYSADRPEGC